eukprot:6249410-Heterocapsa_arctica.AAC.1
MESMKSEFDDPFRALDAKLHLALHKMTKGEPARQLAIIMERLAEQGVLISGRQHLLFIYQQFLKNGHKTDAVAYRNLGKI